ncbi:MAG: restriction endonuclease subunit S [Syntrophales bacterium]
MSQATINNVTSSFVASSAFRLDASSFLKSNRSISLVTIEASGNLSDLADVFTVYIQTPILYYVERFSQSRPYLTTSELGEYQDHALSHVSLIADPRLVEWEIRQGNIVLSRSGRVGDAYWVDRKLDGALVGDSFRVVPKNPEDGYFLYTLLSSSLAKNYMMGVSYGSVVEHASVAQARSLPIPRIKENIRSRISDLVKSALEARDIAYGLLAEAESVLLRVNDLPEISESSQCQFDPLGNPEFTEVKASHVIGIDSHASEYRLDAHFYNPLAQSAIETIKKSKKNEIKSLSDVTLDVRMSPLFVRKYVDKENGVPYIAGKNISQTRPEFKYISRTATENLDIHILHQGWTLMTCAGTIGKIGYVWSFLDESAAQDLMRIIPDENKIDGGYLNAWMSSGYGRAMIKRYKYGSVVDRISPEQTSKILILLPKREEQEKIGALVRTAYEKRADAIRLEDEAQKILMDAVTQ